MANLSRDLAAAQLDTSTLLLMVARSAGSTVGDACAVRLLTDDGRWLVPAAAYDPTPGFSPQRWLHRRESWRHAHEGVPAQVLRSGQPVLLACIEQADADPCEQLRTHSLVMAPLRAHGEVFGVVSMHRRSPGRPYNEEDQSFLMSLADRAALHVVNARLYEQVRSSNQQLQALSRRLVEIQEEERRALARELHDEVGQMLTGLNLMLAAARRTPATGVQAALLESQHLIGDLLGRVRAMALDLRPSMLDDLGLVPAMRWHIERYETQTGIHVHFKERGLLSRLARNVETAVYRITQEALTNVARHAHARGAEVKLRVIMNVIVLQVSDNGRGFDLGAATFSTGLTGMRERALSLGGGLRVESAEGRGTRVTAALPALAA